MKHPISILILASALAGCGQSDPNAGSAAGASGNAAPSGRQLFSPCAVCHAVKEGDAARVGPNLYGIVGRQAGADPAFAYSKAMRESGVVWTEDNLDAFIENPQMFIRGNRMGYAGERNAEKRAAIIDYLKTLKPAAD